MKIEAKLTSLLETASGEREVAAFLKQFPQIVLRAVVRFGDGTCVVSEFPFGTEYRADFVVLAPFSGGWEIHFVELEPPSERLFNADGTMAKRLNKATAQIDSWRMFIDQNRRTVLHDLARFAKERDLLHGPREKEPTCHVGWPLYHPRSCLLFQYDIVIGRRGQLSDQTLQAKGSFRDNHKVEIMTYDRLIDIARQIDGTQQHKA